MRYLPIYPEKSWDEVVTNYPYPRDGPAWEGLPVTNTFLSAARGFSQDARRAKDPLTWATDIVYWLWSLWWSVLVWPVTDTIWNIWNTALNWYKRLYNYWANAYNNVADAYNNWQMQRNNLQTSLTWRRITNNINPANYNMTVAEVEKPTKYLAYNWQPVAQIVEPNPTEIKVVPAQNTQAKRLIVNELSRMSNTWEIQSNPTRAQKLINLYNKIK